MLIPKVWLLIYVYIVSIGIKKINKTSLIVQFTITFYLLLRFSCFFILKSMKRWKIVPHVSFLPCFYALFSVPTEILHSHGVTAEAHGVGDSVAGL